MRVAVLTREYPPEVYGGAGVHVEHLTRHLGNYCDLEVHCFGPPRVAEPPIKAVFSYQPWVELDGEERYLDALRPMSVNLAMAAKLGGTDIVHSHTWYTNLAGHLAKSLHDVPHVVTVHSLEPKRPWKQDQIGSGYRISSFCERSGLESADAIIAVSASVADDIVESYPLVDPARIRVIPNAIDTEEWRPDSGTEIFDTFNIDPGRPIVLYVGRITPQKGIKHLIAAAQHFDPSVQLVLRAGPADTPELEKEFSEQLDALRARRGGIIWIKEFLDPPQLSQLLSHSTVSCCPSVYEPFGLVNLEAMACEVPVVGSAVGGIPEVIDDGITGILVPVEFAGSGGIEPADPERFAHDLALAINVLIANPHLAHKMGQLGRRRVLENFTWSVSARRTYDLYGELRH